MKRKIELWIGTTAWERKADLGDDNIILMNWSNGDLTEPAQVKNSWSKQITLPGTPVNDDIFGSMWSHDRETDSFFMADGKTGAHFNPSVRTPFQLFDSGALVESGYLKMDEIETVGATHSYKVTLYGGLGGFLFSLHYDEFGGKRTLADLVYKARNGNVQDLGFTISKEAVGEAWQFLSDNAGPHYLQDDKWDFINFAPAYNGYPSGAFSAEKAIADVTKVPIPASVDGYSPSPSAGGQTVMITFPDKKTEWETRDLRSYLQRPVLRFGAFLSAIADPENNGGYTVDLDETIFDPALADNPYVWDTWLTLPLLTSLSVNRPASSQAFSISVGQNTIPTVSGAAASFHIEIAPKIGSGSSVRYLYNGQDQLWMNWIQVDLSFYSPGGSLVRQEIIRFGPKISDAAIEEAGITNRGNFDSSGNWTGDPAVIEWSNPAGIGNETYGRVDVSISNGGDHWYGHRPARVGYVWTDPGNYSTAVSYTASLVSSGAYNTSAVDGVRSFVDVKASDLLRSTYTPADYLLSFCKMFGMRIIFEPVQKKVTITGRYKYFSNRTPVDISGRINRGKPITTTPLVFDKRFYSFASDYSHGAWAKYYNGIHGTTYGSMRVDTGYGFDAGTNDVMASVVFRGAVQILESSRFFCRGLVDSRIVPGVFYDSGASYQLYDNNGDAKTFPIPYPVYTYDFANRSGYPYFDVNDKPQFHEEGNAPYDERDTLLFFEGMELRVYDQDYRLTDDSAEMMVLNQNTPCWDLTGGTVLYEMPHFSRYGDRYINTYYASLDFGTPAEIPVPELAFADGIPADIYSRNWKQFIGDRMNANTRVVRCYVNLGGMAVGQDLLRKFYYFDGAIWSLNKITNYSLTTWDDTECEFVKVQDVNNY